MLCYVMYQGIHISDKEMKIVGKKLSLMHTKNLMHF